MAYSDFTLARVKETLNLVLEETYNLFVEVKGVTPSELLIITLNDYIPLATAINTEKARSELLIIPISTEVRHQLKYQVSLFSGDVIEYYLNQVDKILGILLKPIQAFLSKSS